MNGGRGDQDEGWTGRDGTGTGYGVVGELVIIMPECETAMDGRGA